MENADDPQQRPRSWLLVALVLLPVLYLASAGPLYGLHARGILSETAWESLSRSVFAPLAWMETETDLFKTLPGEVYLRYIHFFEP